MKTVWKIVLLVVALIVLFLIFIYSGWYNVAATSKHTAVTLWVIETTMDHSVSNHAGGIEVPNLDDSAMIALGFTHFDETCIDCHGAPGIGSDEFAEGLYPSAPSLADHEGDWSAAELFWITKHGIKMTGMPAFGVTHSDDDIWAIVAFLQKLPDLGYYGYLNMREQAEASGESHEEDEEDHEH
jgi:cytochrome c553